MFVCVQKELWWNTLLLLTTEMVTNLEKCKNLFISKTTSSLKDKYYIGLCSGNADLKANYQDRHDKSHLWKFQLYKGAYLLRKQQNGHSIFIKIFDSIYDFFEDKALWIALPLIITAGANAFWLWSALHPFFCKSAPDAGTASGRFLPKGGSI